MSPVVDPVGSPGASTVAGRWLEVLMELVGRVEEVSRAAEDAVPRAQWAGEAHDAYRDAVRRTVADVDAVCERVRQVARALVLYDDAVRADDGEEGSPRVRRAEEVLAAVLSQGIGSAGGPCVPVSWRPEDPEALAGGAAAVARWWRGLDPERRLELQVALGGAGLGTYAGLPGAARSRAHRLAVRLDLALLRAKVADGTATRADRRALANAEAVARAARPGASGRRQVWWYDARAHGGDGEVVIAVGDVDGAERVAVTVPGLTTTAQDAPRWAGAMDDLVAAAQQAGAGETAGVFWLRYDAPDGPHDPATYSTGRASEGGEVLARDVETLRETRRGLAGPGGAEVPWVTAVGHSFGATTVAEAAATHGLVVDAVALVGAPGAGSAERAADLGAGAVYVGRDSRDAVATLGDEGGLGKFGLGNVGVGLGVDPSSEEFGAVRFRAERPDRGTFRGVGEAHSSYFDPGSESLRNLGRVVAGRGERVEVAEAGVDPWWGMPYDPESVREVAVREVSVREVP